MERNKVARGDRAVAAVAQVLDEPGSGVVAGDPTAQRSVQSVEVGGRLLLALADSRSDLSLKDLAARAGLTPSRAHPYLVSFSRLGLVEQRQASGRYGSTLDYARQTYESLRQAGIHDEQLHRMLRHA